jgi:type IV secretion system protein VirD4
VVLPTLYSWKGSAVVYDIKKELWNKSAGWRRKFTHCLKFEPASKDSVRFNPLLEVRQGDHEVADVQNIADILVDPSGSKPERSHWDTTAARPACRDTCNRSSQSVGLARKPAFASFSPRVRPL